MKEYKWILAQHSPEKISELARLNSVPKFVAAAFLSRGLADKESIDYFLRSNETAFHNPYLLKGMAEAVERIDEALDNGEKITVYGDYDADGITAAYILYTYLKENTENVDCYIPDRIDEGYGLSEAAIDSLIDTNLIITVDTGITAFNQVEYAKSKGIDIIITDHHTPVDEIPDAVAVIDPKQTDCKYPYKELAGVGVALKLVYALSDCDRTVVDRFCAVAAIGTIADLCNLMGENRYIVSNGLRNMRVTDNVGLKSLFAVSGVDQRAVTTSTIGFTIGPMLNAAGRIASPYIAFELLISDDKEKAYALAQQLCLENDKRKAEEKAIVDYVIENIDNSAVKDDNVIVVSGRGWHRGVIGIVASRITDRYYRPSIVIATDGVYGKGSCRSIEGFNLFEAIDACGEELVKYGGHTMAVGLTIEEEKIDAFKNKINSYAKSLLTEDVLTPKLYIDGEIDISEFDVKNIQKLRILEPCGVGNKTPVYCICSATIRSIKISKNHAFLNLEKNGYNFNVPAFNRADDFNCIGTGDVIDVAGVLNVNEYNGIYSPQLLLKDWRLSEIYSIVREDVASVYRMISSSEGRINKDQVRAYLDNISLHKVHICLEVMKELDIVKSFSISAKHIYYEKGVNFNRKTDLESSPTYIKYSQEGGVQ